jgi:UDP-N-acetyl-D-mannosaminuronic acid transferase (WecB/TagA/CpsF family)
VDAQPQARTTGAAGRPEAWLLGVRFDLYTRAELRAWIRELLASPARTIHIAFSNSEFLLEARRNPRLRSYLNR